VGEGAPQPTEAGVDEPAITEEMILTGAEALWGYHPEDFNDRDVVVEIYRAMRR
jgi:hypothetical protein